MKSQTWLRKVTNVFLALVFALSGLTTLTPAEPVAAAGGLTLTIIAAPNLVVDSNALSPSTYSPKVATVIAKVCNTGPDPVNGVTAYIGNYTGSGAGTPGIYPTITNATIGPAGTQTTYNGTYSFTHLGGTADAARFMGTLAVGQCRYQYWSFEYPLLANGGTIPTWGNHVKPDDDLYLDFDMWVGGDVDGDGTVESSEYVNDNHTMYMRNEISAMANKIKPNGNPSGEWFNTDTSVVYPGQTVTTNGILYRLGNINQGFDNDGDGVPDYNAWVQPFGDPAYDPSCFRLVGVTGVLTVTRGAGNPDMIIPIYNNLYFSNLPPDNTDVRGEVFYEFLALNGACNVPITPYQEVASGFDNEKFNGDYGTGVPALMSYEPEVDITKSAPGTQAVNTTFTYSIPFVNNSPNVPAGLIMTAGGVGVNAGLMISDTVPLGLQYVANSAGNTVPESTNSIPAGNGVTIYFSTNGGATWMINDPGNYTSTSEANRLIIQWWLNQPLDDSASGNNAGYVRYRATIPSGYSGASFIENCAEASFGAAAPFDRACVITMVRGNNSIGNEVYADVNANGVRDAGESVLSGIDVWLYWDRDGDGVIDADDPLVGTTTTNSTSTGNYLFSNLPDARFIVKIDTDDAPAGYRPINPTTGQIAVDVSAAGADNITTADFGLGPALALTKTSTSKGPTASNGTITYKIELKNQLPGDGTTNRACVYKVWASTQDISNSGTGQAAWLSIPNIFGSPDTGYAVDPLVANSEKLGVSGFNITTPGTTITKVELVLPIKIIGTKAGTFQVTLNTYGGASVRDYGVEQISTFSDGERVYPVWQTGDPASPFASWSAYTGNVYSVVMEGKKSGNLTDLNVDAVGFKITTTGTCGDNSTDITVLPLTDTYDPAVLEFVSASINPDSTSPAGTLTWNNVGPLYAGGTRDVFVTFRVRTTAASGTNNTATSTNAQFGDGKPTNSPVSDTEPILGIVGDRVWFDVDGDNVQDAGETGIPGVTVRLCDTSNCNNVVYATATTDANGNYLFSGLAFGTTYYVNVTGPASPPYSSNTTGATNPRAFTPSASNVVDLSYDVGYDTRDANTGGVSGYVWNDIDADGVIDTGEMGYSGVTVQLCQGTEPTCSTSLGTVTTDASGFYQFANIAAGTNRFVRVTTPPASTTETYEYNTVCSGSCNNATVNFSVVANTITTDINLGYRATGTAEIGDLVWRDWDGDGLIDSAEEGINGVTVKLYLDNDNDGVVDATDYLYATQTTAYNATYGDGYYKFTNLPAGNWIVVVTPPSGHYQTYDPDESAPCATCNSTSRVTTTSSSSTLTQDYAYKPYGVGEIGDLVFIDQNGDGDWDTGEPGLPNITVNLYEDSNGNGVIDTADALIATTSTDANGAYLFTNLYVDSTAGQRYLVDVATDDADLPEDSSGLVYVLTTNNDPMLVTLTSSSTTNYTADFGFMPRSAIGDFVWLDSNGDGLWENGELGIGGVLVELYEDANNNGIADDLAIRSMQTMYNIIYGYLDMDNDGVTSGDTGDTGTISLDGLSYTVTNGRIDVNRSGTIDDNDDGFFAGYSVIDGYFDMDGDGVTAGTDIGDKASTLGLYIFSGLMSNNYIVKVASSNFGAGGALYDSVGGTRYIQTYDPDAYTEPCSGTQCDDESWVEGYYTPAPNSIFFAGLQPGYNDMSSDFGYQPPALIGDFVWQDLDGDGTQDSGEPGIAGVLINLYADSNNDGTADGGAIATVTTNNEGYYYFAGRPAGNYIVQVASSNFDSGQPLYGYTQTGDPEGNNDNLSDADTASGASDLTNDFGYQGNRLISGTIFFDRGTLGGIYSDNGSALDDLPFSGVQVYLYDDTGKLVGSTFTNSSGYYGFKAPAGAYVVRVADSLSIQIKGMFWTYEPSLSTQSSYCGDFPATCNNSAMVDVTSGDKSNQDFGLFAHMDCGDLPNTYNSTTTEYNTPLQNEGPCHINNTGNDTPPIYLGNAWAPDTDGKPNATATGDDDDGTNDEDGINFGSSWSTLGATVNIIVTVSDNDATAIPYLVGWFDWNGDGDFGEANEMYQFGDMRNGENVVSVTLPGTAPAGGKVNIRFRLYEGQSPPPVISYVGIVTNGEVEDYQRDYNPTAITLAAFEATPQGGASILVTWETAMELDNVGFNLYRSTAAAGPYTQLNAELIPPQFPGEVMGGLYEWLDTDVQPGVTYYYKLEDIDVKGVSTFNGPVSTTVVTTPTAVQVQRIAAHAPFAPAVLGLLMLVGVVFTRRRRRER